MPAYQLNPMVAETGTPAGAQKNRFFNDLKFRQVEEVFRLHSEIQQELRGQVRLLQSELDDSKRVINRQIR